MDEDRSYIEDELAGFPSEVRIMPFNIEPEYMLEFQAQLDEQIDEAVDEAILEESIWDLPNKEDFKHRIVSIALLGSVASFRYMEKTVAAVDEKTERWQEVWIDLGVLHAQMFMEQNLLDTPVGFIISGLGGENNCIRYCFAVRTENEVTEHLASYIHGEFNSFMRNEDAALEESFTFGKHYVCMTVLIPYKASPVEIIEKCIQKLNFLDNDHITSNMHIFTEEELLSWLDD
jgi:hypothetical protein